MFFIWGSRRTTKPLGQIEYSCSKCRKTAVHTANVVTGKFTFFFVPIFTLRKQYLIVCNLCGLRLKAVDNLLAQLQAWEKTGRLPPAKSPAT